MTAPALIASRLTPAQREALSLLPLPRAADPVRWQAARTFGSLWRKCTGHSSALRELQELGIVESTISRGETLWRPTKPLGLAVRQHLLNTPEVGRDD